MRTLLHRTVLALVALLLLANFAAPVQACALEVQKCTAKPNAGAGSTVIGDVGTRVTWEGQAGEDESIKAIHLVMPEGTSFSLDNARLTVLSGDDLMTRDYPEVTFEAEGETCSAVLAEPAPAGSYFRIELYDVVFPGAGGDMQLGGTYELANGVIMEIVDTPAIPVAVTSPADRLANKLEQQEWVQRWNSNTFLRLFLNPPTLVRSFPLVLRGFGTAIAVVAVAYPLAIPIGFLLSLMRISRFRILRALGALYVNVVRGTPMFLQLYIAFFGLPLAGIQLPNLLLAMLVLAMNSAAYLCEIFRAGIQSIPKGQTEASRSLGMTGFQTMVFVVIPQTIRRVLPTMTSEFILLYKDTSLLAAVGLMELVYNAKTIVATTGSITPYIVAACFYLVITIPLANLVGRLERRLAGTDGGAGAAKAKGKKKRARKSKDVPALAAEDVEQASTELGNVQLADAAYAAEDSLPTRDKMSAADAPA